MLGQVEKAGIFFAMAHQELSAGIGHSRRHAMEFTVSARSFFRGSNREETTI